MAPAICTCITQNRGAVSPDRIRKDFLTGLAVMVSGSHLAALFIKDNGTAEVISEGTACLSVKAQLCTLPGFPTVSRDIAEARERFRLPFSAHSYPLCTIGTILPAGKTGIKSITAASGTGWTAMLLFEVSRVLHHMKNLEQRKYQPEIPVKDLI